MEEKTTYNLTLEDFEQIRKEVYQPAGSKNYCETAFRVMDEMFPGYLYKRLNTFESEEALKDCLSAARIRIVERLRWKFFEQKDREQTPESLQKWMFTVMKNVYFTKLRETQRGQEILEKLRERQADRLGIVRRNDGQILLDGEPEGTGEIDEILRRETLEEHRAKLTECFAELVSGRSEGQIVLAWLAVAGLNLVKDMDQKTAIAYIADRDPKMGHMFVLVKRLVNCLPWMALPEEAWEALARKMDRPTEDGRTFFQLRYGDFTQDSVRSYISKSINKRNVSLTKRYKTGDDFSF